MSNLKMLVLLLLVFLPLFYSQEPSCYTSNRFEYEFNVLHKLDVLEQSRTELISISETLTEQVASLQNRLREIVQENEDIQARLQHYSRMKDPGGSTYVRWGRTTCPETSELVYDGYAGGGSYSEAGAGTNYLCLPKDPEWIDEQSPSYVGYIHGAEYQTHSSMFDSIKDHDVPCAFCHTNSTNVFVLPAKQTCPTGWTQEYSGFLMSERNTHSSKEFICMDRNPESITGSYVDRQGALFHFQKAVCGSLPCPPYINNRELMCVVCTK